MRRPVAVIESTYHKFVLFDAPDDETLPAYIEELQKYNVTHVVRTCEPTYNIAPLQKAHIEVHEMCFADGSVPSHEIVTQWLELLRDTKPKEGNKKTTIGVHCVAGLGRTPVLVAIALIETGGMNPLEAVALIRKHRKGAVNKVQLAYLQKYKPKNKKSCSIM